MTGPEHYHEAETLLEESGDPADHGVSALHAHIARAQVHATLALAAATVDAAPAEYLANADEWREVQR